MDTSFTPSRRDDMLILYYILCVNNQVNKSEHGKNMTVLMSRKEGNLR